MRPLFSVVYEAGGPPAGARALMSDGGSYWSRGTPLAELMEVVVVVTDSPEGSLFLAARLLQTAADQAEDDTRTGRATYETESEVKVLLWLCGSLLGEGRVLRSTSPADRPVRELLHEAERELRRFPIGEYPAGTMDVVIGVCDLIRDSRSVAYSRASRKFTSSVGAF